MLIKRRRAKGSNAFVLTTGMLNSKDASVMMWAHGMEAHRGDAPYQFEFELETKDGRLLGGAIMKVIDRLATRTAPLAALCWVWVVRLTRSVARLCRPRGSTRMRRR